MSFSSTDMCGVFWLGGGRGGGCLCACVGTIVLILKIILHNSYVVLLATCVCHIRNFLAFLYMCACVCACVRACVCV